jgi:hypothetical protein
MNNKWWRFGSRWMACVLVVCVMALVSGCGGGTRASQLVGTWKLKVNMPSSGEGNAGMKAGQVIAKEMLGKSNLEFKADKTFAMNLMTILSEGIWTFNESDGTAQLNMTKIMGKDITEAAGAKTGQQEPMIFLLSPDNKQLIIQNKAGVSDPSGVSMTFEKQ